MARADECPAGATLTVEDDRRNHGEDRFITIRYLDDLMVGLVWTPRGGAHRIVSMRRANEGSAKQPGDVVPAPLETAALLEVVAVRRLAVAL